MALQGSGAISISQIKTELGSSSNSLRALSAAAGKSTPDAMSEFYGYSAFTYPTLTSGHSSFSGAGTASNPYIITPSWYDNSVEEVDVSVEYGYQPGEALWYWSYTGYSVNLAVNSPGTLRINSRITTWNNSSSSGCQMSYAYKAYGIHNVYGEQQKESSVSGIRGTDQLVNVTYTSPQTAVTTGNTAFSYAWAKQFFMEIFMGDYYYYCSDNMTTTALTVQIWFDKF